MTDRYYALTVILERDIKEGDAEPILNAIKMIKGVRAVKGNIADPSTWMAEERARFDLEKKLLEVVFSEEKYNCKK
jgi:hypothetical protein